jgi:signal recognition particle receptor subunit beta
MAVYKMYLGGLISSGKTATIKAVSDLPLVSVLKKIALTQRAVPLDYGRVYIKPDMCYFYASASGVLGGSDWHGLSEEMDCLLYIVDGTIDDVHSAADSLLSLMSTWPGPTVVGVNGVDRPEYVESVYHALAGIFGSSCVVYPYSAHSRTSVFDLVKIAIDAISTHAARA